MPFNPFSTFLQEAEELTAEIERCALELSSEEAPEETVHRLFRAFHTIKGSSGMCGLNTLSEFTHHVENILDRVREGTMPVSDELIALILESTDHIKSLLNAEQSGEPLPSGAAKELEDRLALLLSGGMTTKAAAPLQGERATNAGPERTWQIRFLPSPDLLANGGSPMALLKDLRTLGPCEITAHPGDVPTLDAIEPDQCYLWWTVILRSACGEQAIHDVFMFVEDESKLEIEWLRDQEATTRQPDSPVRTASNPAHAAPRDTEVTVRVPAERLDHLVNLVGELVMNHSCLAQAAARAGGSDLTNAVQVLERLVAELRDNVLGIRMLPIGTLFGRFQRVVHDLSAGLGKEACLVTDGAETELDKSILDQLSEPLVHCLRNCLDHGIEPPPDRVARGKPPRGTIRLSAAHMGSSVIVRIEDDGRGIDREAVRAKAIEKQIISPEATLSEEDILNLILLPGFSTAREVTAVSGRGVGMDAVKRQIDALRGTLSIASTPGEGTRMSITLPLTLAIIEGLLVEVGREQFILPMAAVTENVELDREQRSRNNGRNLLAVRGGLIPFIDLRNIFHVGGDGPAIQKVVIVQHGADRVGLVVDRVVGTHQTVIQSLGKFYKTVEVASGATIMGDGRVALIIDIGAVVRHTDRLCRQVHAA